MSDSAPAETIRFGVFEVDLRRRELRKHGVRIRLHNQPLQLLLVLIENAGQVVTREELRARLWDSGTFVDFDVGLNSAIKKLRDALSDSAEASRFIETVPRRGYRFIAPIDGGSEPVAPERPHIARWKIGAAVLMAFVAIAVVIALTKRTTHAPIRSLAILPFDTTASDRADQHLGIGLADLLITRLSNVRHLVVRPTSAIRSYEGRQFDSLDAGRRLNVDAVLEGSIRTTPDRVRVTVQLLNVREQKAIWAGEFDQKRSDVFVIEDRISQQVADALMAQVPPNERALLGKRYTADPEAYELYLQAKYRDDTTIREGRVNLTSSIPLLHEAVKKDPSYALAWASLAQLYAVSGAFNQLPPQSAFDQARVAVQKALQLDDELSEAHCAAGVIKMYWDRDYPAAEREFQRALSLDPRNTAALMHYGRLVQCLGRFDEAITLRKREVEIDPSNPGIQSFLAATYLTARKDDLGIQQCQRILRMDPNFSFAYTSLARIYAVRGEYDKAIANGRAAVRTDREGFQSLAILGYALGMSGKRAEASEILQRLQKEKRAQPFDIAIVELSLGHKDDALGILEKALDDRTYFLRLKTEPIFQPLHSDPRFQALLRRAGFES